MGSLKEQVTVVGRVSDGSGWLGSGRGRGACPAASYTCRSSATAARIHLAAFSFVLRLKVQT